MSKFFKWSSVFVWAPVVKRMLDAGCWILDAGSAAAGFVSRCGGGPGYWILDIGTAVTGFDGRAGRATAGIAHRLTYYSLRIYASRLS
ncbi:MAG: hypothetical protein QF473_02895 [Planctomycetota bacterium]|nr:hypothetical protein [Planctomycetota bacterium]MDP6507396.1 hypothetical protein [Planctomycetota bacterium]